MGAAGLFTFALTAALYGGLIGHLGTDFPVTAFDRGHFRVYESALRGNLGLTVYDVAFPVGGYARYMGWVGIVVTGVLQPAVGALSAYMLSVWLGPAFGAAAAVPLLRRVTRLDIVSAGCLAPLAGLSPVVIGFLRSGQTAKSHVWTLELALLAVVIALDDQRWRSLIAVGATAVLVGFQAPPLGLLLPLGIAVPLMVGVARAEVGRRAPVLRRVGMIAVASVVGLAGPAEYTASGIPPGGGHAFVEPAPTDPIFLVLPARNPDTNISGGSTPSVADPLALVRGSAHPPSVPDGTVHLIYIGMPALLLAALALHRRGVGWQFGAGLMAVGAATALGPYLSWGGHLLLVGNRLVPGPAFLLRALHYPLADSGLWFRAMALVGPGLAILLASGLAEIPPRRRQAAAAIAALVILADTARAAAPLLPIPSQTVADRNLLARIHDDPASGAVLELPFERGQLDGEAALFRAALHGRASSVVPNHTLLSIYPHLRALDRDVRADLRSGSPKAALRARGFAWVVFDTDVTPPPLPNQRPASGAMTEAPALSERDLSTALGPGDVSGALRYWALNP